MMNAPQMFKMCYLSHRHVSKSKPALKLRKLQAIMRCCAAQPSVILASRFVLWHGDTQLQRRFLLKSVTNILHEKLKARFAALEYPSAAHETFSVAL